MKLLITAATENELLTAQKAAKNTSHHITFAVTGIGVTPTAYHTTRLLLSSSYDMALNTGIAGSYGNHIAVGSVVSPVKEYFGDSGVQTPDGFRSLFYERLLEANTFPFTDGALKNNIPLNIKQALGNYRPATGVTVQTVTGTPARIDELRQRFAADIETMEGAAFFYVCLSQGIPFLALRAISNKVEVRNKNKWNIPLAMQQLETAIKEIVEKI